MRVSSHDDDRAAYAAYRAILANGQEVVVHLDGVRQQYVFLADDEAGVVERYKTDARGELYVVGEGEGTTAASETLTGRVVIELVDRK